MKFTSCLYEATWFSNDTECKQTDCSDIRTREHFYLHCNKQNGLQVIDIAEYCTHEQNKNNIDTTVHVGA